MDVGSTPTISTKVQSRAVVARQAHNLKVKGSNPFSATIVNKNNNYEMG